MPCIPSQIFNSTGDSQTQAGLHQVDRDNPCLGKTVLVLRAAPPIYTLHWEHDQTPGTCATPTGTSIMVHWVCTHLMWNGDVQRNAKNSSYRTGE